MHYAVSEKEISAAKLPHEIFLFNLITNHILIFVGLLGLAGSYPWVMLITPAISLVLLSYLILRAKQSLRKDSWYVFSHWQLCAFRSKLFIGIILLLALVVAVLIFTVGGDFSKLRPGHYALAGVAFIPTLLSVLTLIVMESDAVHKAKSGEVPQSIVNKFPPPADVKPVQYNE
ncbi:MAG: hypothetical protein K0A95_11640 [Chromatiales bacterium]|nr:hypothetical protein [Gammaproteobacteria bacterium]MBW6477709.1 hypothetical protein [Chromatiales bacterium]